MICQICNKDFPEAQIDLSHDVPKYLFCIECPNPKVRHHLADKFGRHNLCKECHRRYEVSLNNYLKHEAKDFATGYFKHLNEVDDGNNS